MIQRRSLLAGLLLAGMAPGIVRASSLVRSKVIVPDYRGLVILDRSGNLLCASSARAWGWNTLESEEMTILKLDAIGIDGRRFMSSVPLHR